jgi:CRP-like cAMP-binding protein
MKAITSSSKVRSKKKHPFNAQAFLDSAGLARTVVEYRRSETIYIQGETAENVLYVQKDGIKLSVVNEVGKEAVVAMLGPGDFFGEGGPGRSACSYGDGDRNHAHDITCY